MILKQFISSTLDQNIYLLISDNKDAVMIDPGDKNIDEVIKYIKENDINLKAIFITHGHFDHIMGVNKLVEYKKVPVYIGKEDEKLLYDPSMSMSKAFIGEDVIIDRDVEVIKVNDQDEIFGLLCVSTPGHTKGSTCYYAKELNSIFTGDTLFKMAYGRTDFPTGDSRELRDSLNKLFQMEDSIIVYPGHGLSTTIKEERELYYGMFY